MARARPSSRGNSAPVRPDSTMYAAQNAPAASASAMPTSSSSSSGVLSASEMSTTPSPAATTATASTQPPGQHGGQGQRADELDGDGHPDRQVGQRAVEGEVHHAQRDTEGDDGAPGLPRVAAPPRPHERRAAMAVANSSRMTTEPPAPMTGTRVCRQRAAELHRDDARRGPGRVLGPGRRRSSPGQASHDGCRVCHRSGRAYRATMVGATRSGASVRASAAPNGQEDDVSEDAAGCGPVTEAAVMAFVGGDARSVSAPCPRGSGPRGADLVTYATRPDRAAVQRVVAARPERRRGRPPRPGSTSWPSAACPSPCSAGRPHPPGWHRWPPPTG